MVRGLAVLIVCFTAACSPVVVTVPAGGDMISRGEIMPAEAQRIIDAATATAGAVATQAAQATAAEGAARATVTTAAQQTRDALVVEQTRSALTLTQAAGLALATDAAAVRTHAAGETAAWSTPTVAAVRTQAALDALEQRRQLARAESEAEFWRTVRATLVAAVQGLSLLTGVWLLARAVVAVWDRVTRVRMERLAQQAAIAREAFRLLGPGHWAEWQPADGYQVYPLPGAAPALPVLEAPPANPSRLQAWRHAVRLFAWWGDCYGFGIRDLGPAGAGVVTDPAWRKLSKLLKDAGVLAEAVRPGGPGGGPLDRSWSGPGPANGVAVPDQRGKVTTWADGWSFHRLSDELGSLRPPVALPLADEPPDVRFAVPTTTPQLTQHSP